MDQTPLPTRIREIAYSRVRYGYFQIYLLQRKGWPVNHKRIHHLYQLEGLNLRYKRPRCHKSSSQHITSLPAEKINQYWCMDFVIDQLFTDTQLQFLMINEQG